MKRWICLAMCVLLMSFTTSASALPSPHRLQPDSEDELERRAYQELVDEKEEAFLQTCSEAIVLNPTVAWPYEELADYFIYFGDKEDACELLLRGFEAGAESAYMRFSLGFAQFYLDQFEDARTNIEIAIAMNDSNDSDLLQDSYDVLSSVLKELELYDQAYIAAARSAVLKEPDRPELLLDLWIALDGCGQHDEALRIYAQWSESRPEMAATLDTVLRAEEKYLGESYEEATMLYEQLAGEEYLPAALVIHYIQALMHLSRHEDALAELDRGMGDIIPSPLQGLLMGDV